VTSLALTQLLPEPVEEKVQDEVFCPEIIDRQQPLVHLIESTGGRLFIVNVAPEEQTSEGPEMKYE
jgi:hypothetical protein